MDKPVWFEVKMNWLHACGHRHYDKATAFQVIRTWDAGMMAFAELDMGDGRTWQVNTEWRGRFVNPPEAEGADPAYNAEAYTQTPAMSADEAVKDRTAPGTIAEHDMGTGWRVIVAQRPDGHGRTWYFHNNDDARLAEALRRNAAEWLESGR